jgi:hypothetical protein
LAEIDYCDLPLGHDWRESQPPPSYCGEFSQDEIDDWVTQANDKWFPKEPKSSADGAKLGLEQQFLQHAAKWERETAHLSSPTQMMKHPSFEAILLMGEPVVPLMIRDLEKNRRYWFGALTYLTGENPITPAEAGKMDRMINSWVKWGKAKGRV